MTNIENDIKLDILHSLARSQKAIARIMESVADISNSSKSTALYVSENIKSMNQYQRILADKMLGIRIIKVKKSLNNTQPWLNKDVPLYKKSGMN